jgi:sugar lactone lactonase YvrE
VWPWTADWYVSDTANNVVRRIRNGVITAYAGNRSAGFGGDGGAATSAQLNSPTGLAVDSAGNLYISDSANSRVRRVAASGTISTVAGNGTQATGMERVPWQLVHAFARAGHGVISSPT